MEYRKSHEGMANFGERMSMAIIACLMLAAIILASAQMLKEGACERNNNVSDCERAYAPKPTEK